MESKLKVSIDGSGATSGANEVTGALRGINSEAKNTSSILDSVTDSLRKMGSEGSGLRNFMKDVFSIETLLMVSKTIFDVSNRLQGFVSTMSVVTGSMSAARDEMNYLFSVANKWGADIDSVTGSYAKLAAAAKGTTLEGQGVRQIFEAITQASTALHLSTQDTTLVFFALQQMVSKGKVSMEELRKQLAERFPGAIQIAADSMNVTVDVMEKMIKKGEVLAADFLPAFAEGIQAAFGDAATLASHSLLAEINRLKNAWESFLLKLAESGVIESASESVRLLTEMLTGNNEVAASLGEALSKLINYVNEFLKSLKPGDIKSFFDALVQAVNIVIDVFGGLVKGLIWVKENLGFLGTAIMFVLGLLNDLVQGFKQTVALFSGDITFKQWAQGVDVASTSTKRFGMSNDDARDKMAQLANEAQRKIDIDAKGLKNAQNALADSERAVAIKTKEISLTAQLNVLTAERVQLQKIVNDGSVTDKDRTAAITQLIALNKEYGKVKAAADTEAARMSKAAATELKQQWAATETLTKSLEKQEYALTHTRLEEELNAAAIATSTIRKKADRDAMFDRLSAIIRSNDELRRAAEEEKALTKIYIEHIQVYDKQIEAADKSIEKAKAENEEIGKSKSQIELLKAARLDTAIATLEATLATVESANACTEEAEKIKTLIARLKELKAVQTDSANKLADQDFLKDATSANKKIADDFRKTSDSISQSLTDALLRGFEKGESFAENFKTTLLNMFKTMILKPIIQPILSDAVGGISNLLGIKPNPNGSGFTFDFGGGGSGSTGIFGNGSSGGGSGFSLEALGNMFTKSYNNSLAGKFAAGQYSGNNDPNMGPIEGFDFKSMMSDGIKTALAGAAIGAAVGSVAAQVFGNERNKSGIQTGATIGGAIGMIWGPIGALIGAAIGAAIGSLIKSGGGPKSGGFYANGDTTGISGTDSTGRWFTPKDKDKDVKVIVDATAKSYSELLRQLGGTGHATFALGFDVDPKGTAPNRTHSGVFMNGHQIYDSQQSDLGKDPEVLKAALELESKKAILAALQASELPQFLAKMIDGVDIASLDAGAAENIFNVLTALKTLSDVFGGLNASMASLDSTQVTALIDAFGGIEAFTQSMTFLNDNFVSSADKQARAQEKLNTTFESLGLEVPKTHQAFLDLLDSIPLTTEEGRNLYQTIASMAPTFVELNGTADDAAKALSAASDALDKLATNGQKFFDENFLSDSEKNTNRIATDWQSVQDAWTSVGGTLMELGLDHIPTTNKAFKSLIETVKAQYGADSQLYKILIAISPAIWDLNAALDGTSQAVTSATDFFNNNFFNDAGGLAQKIDAAWNIVHSAWTEMGGQLLELGYKSIPTTNAGFRDMIQHLRELGLTELADKLILLAPIIFGLNGNIADLSKLSTGAADSINTLNAALERSQQAAAEAQSAFNTVWNAIEEIVNGSSGTFAEKLALKMKLIPEQMAKIQQQIEDEMARGGIYSPLIQQLKEMLTKLGLENDKAKKELERFTILSAKYGDAKAEELLKLEQWYADQQAALAGSAEALAALTIVFNDKWKGIVDGVSGAGNGVGDALEGILQNIRDFIKGLLTSDLSPLTPREKLAEAKAQYESDLAKAKAGDQEALGRLTEDANTYLQLARQFYASSDAYTQIFNSIVEELKAISKYQEPTTSQETANSAIVAALPTGSTIASAANVQALQTNVVGAISESVSQNEANAKAIVDALVQKFSELINTINTVPK